MNYNIFKNIVSQLPNSYDILLQNLIENYNDIQDLEESVISTIALYLDDDQFEYLNNRYNKEDFASTLVFIINKKYDKKILNDLENL